MITKKFSDVTVLITPLDPLDALDLAPELVAAIAPGMGVAWPGEVAGTDGVGAEGAMSRVVASLLGEGLGMVAAALSGGRLVALLPRLLAGSTMVVSGQAKFELASRESINKALSLRPEMLVPLVTTALEAHFKRFFSGFALAGLKIPKLSRSEDSSPSTNGTGPSTG